jgi:hypothetical protein
MGQSNWFWPRILAQFVDEIEHSGGFTNRELPHQGRGHHFFIRVEMTPADPMHPGIRREVIFQKAMVLGEATHAASMSKILTRKMKISVSCAGTYCKHDAK